MTSILKLIELVNEFRDNFVTKRNYETEDILKETVAIYRDKFLGIESILKSGKDPRAIRAALQSIRINQTEVLLDKLEERKKTERDFANSDTLIKKLLNDLLDVTSTLEETYPLSTEIDYTTYAGKSLFFRLFILKLKFTTWLKTIFTGDHTAIVKVNLKNYSRYYLNVKTTAELLETINLTGADRLNLFRKLKAIHKNFIHYLDELITTIGQEKSSLGFMPVFYMQYEELKAMFFNELDVYIEEQSSTVMNIEKRLTYAFASPYNNLLREITSLIRLDKRGLEVNFFKEFEESQKVKESLFDSIRYWVIYYQGIIGLLQKELYIYKFEIQLNNFLDRALLNLADEISERIRAGSPKIIEQFRQMVTDIKALIPLGYDTLKAYSDHFRMSFVIPELSSLIRDLDKTTRSRKLRTFFDTVINGIKSVAKELPEEAVYLDEEELNLKNRIPEFTKLKTFEIRKQTSSFLLLKLPREIGDVNEFLVDYVDTALKEIRNLESSVNYYLDSIVKRIHEDPEDFEGVEDILNTVSSSFLNRLREIENNNDKLEQAINKQVADKTEVAVTEIKRLIRQTPHLDADTSHKKNTFTLQMNYAFRFVKIVLKKVFHTIKAAISNTYKRFIIPLFARSYERFKILSGKLGTSYKEDLFRLDEILNGLPFIYRRLFDGTSLESSEMFLGKEEIKHILSDAQSRFKNKLPSSVLITGAPGTGKTSCLYFIKNDLLRPGEYLEFYFLERISTVDELRKLISEAFGYNDLKSVEAIIIDLNERFRGKTVLLINLHKTFVRSVDGFEALKTMLHIISMTSVNILWITSVQSTGWQFIKTNFKASSLFTFSISLEELNRRRVKEIILHRQKTTGFGFRFTEDDLYLLRKKIFSSSKSIEDQRYLENVYFERLTDYADGNIVAAMNYWLNSIKKIEGNTLLIQTYKAYPLIDLSFLDTTLITVLHTVMLHGGLKKSQLAQSLNIPESLAGEALNKLLSLNLLKIGELTKSHDYYYTNKFKFKSIQYELKNRNILP
ncbi:MAG: ATP-binding protein [Ignavibacteriales bacterium]|nr:ATP-binding protein [Ignavibacteriales bacterium]